jgi:hypothetical protein
MRTRTIIVIMLLGLLAFPQSSAQVGNNVVIINEFITQPATGKAWVELLVTDSAGADMRGWKLTDLSGPSASTGASEGVLTFPNASYLSSVPAGTIILVVLSTPKANAYQFAADTVLDDNRLVLPAASLADGLLEETGTIDLDAADNLELVSGPLASGTVVDVVSWGGDIFGWPSPQWYGYLPVTAGNGAYFTNGQPGCSFDNDGLSGGWIANAPPSSLTPGESNPGQLLPNSRMWIGSDSVWTNPSNWCPPGSPDGADLFIGMAPARPVIESRTSPHSITIRPGGLLTVRTNGVMSIDGKLTINSGAALRIADPVNILSIRDDIVLDGTLLVDPGIAAKVWCEGNWLPGPGSEFLAGESIFYFSNKTRSLRIDGGTFYSLFLGPAPSISIGDNLTTLRKLKIRGLISIDEGDTLFIADTSSSALEDSVGARFVRGALRRAISPTATTPIRFHDSSVALQFYQTGERPQTVTITAFPDSLVNPASTGWQVRRFYDIKRFGGNNFLTRVRLGFQESELSPTAVKSQLRLWRSTDLGSTWIFVGGTVDIAANAVTADSVTEFSRWGTGTPFGDPTFVAADGQTGPLAYRLLQNYPNPFNPSTTLAFTLPRSAVVSLTVTTVLGQTVANLLQDVPLSAGEHAVQWRAEGLPSGVYIGQLMIDGAARQSMKMLLIR